MGDSGSWSDSPRPPKRSRQDPLAGCVRVCGWVGGCVCVCVSVSLKLGRQILTEIMYDAVCIYVYIYIYVYMYVFVGIAFYLDSYI